MKINRGKRVTIRLPVPLRIRNLVLMEIDTDPGIPGSPGILTSKARRTAIDEGRAENRVKPSIGRRKSPNLFDKPWRRKLHAHLPFARRQGKESIVRGDVLTAAPPETVYGIRRNRAPGSGRVSFFL